MKKAILVLIVVTVFGVGWWLIGRPAFCIWEYTHGYAWPCFD